MVGRGGEKKRDDRPARPVAQIVSRIDFKSSGESLISQQFVYQKYNRDTRGSLTRGDLSVIARIFPRAPVENAKSVNDWKTISFFFFSLFQTDQLRSAFSPPRIPDALLAARAPLFAVFLFFFCFNFTRVDARYASRGEDPISVLKKNEVVAYKGPK